MHTSTGLTAIRYLKSLANGRGDGAAALGFAQSQREWGVDKEFVVTRLKAAVGGLELSSIEGGSQVGHDLMAALRPLTIVGRLQNLRRVPPRTPLLTQVTGSTASWVGQGQGRRLSVGTYERGEIELLTVAALSVATDELLRDGSMEGETELLRDLLAACVEALDRAFIDAANTGSAGITPASVTSSATPIVSGGGTIAYLDADLATAVRQLVAAGSNLSMAAWVMSDVMAAGMGLARGTGGGPAYPGLGALGGTLAGLPVLTSSAVPADSDGEQIALVDASQVTFAEAQPNLRVSRDTAIEMSTTPTGDSTVPTAATTLVSMFQADSAALMAQLAVNWQLRRDGCTQVITGVPSTLDAS